MLIGGFVRWILDKTAKYSLLLLLVAFVGIHVLILSVYVTHNRSPASVEAETKANAALRAVVESASNNMSPKALKQTLAEMTSAGLRIGSYRISFDLEQQKPATDGAEVVTRLPNKQWLIYDENSANMAFYIIALLIVMLEAGIFCFILFYAWSVYRFTGPLKKFKSSAEHLGIQLQAAPVIEQHAPTLVKETANAINKMQERIVDLINKRTRMLASISHDLRTPITRLKLRAEFIADPSESEKIMRDLTEMEEMISEILDFSLADKSKKKNVKFDLNALIFSICDDYLDQGKPVEIEGYSRPAPFMGRPLLLKRTFINLIENAIKYATNVLVKVSKFSDDLIICIEDDGKGLPEDDIRQVFKPFYRSSLNASDGSAGVGLGLTIAQEIIVEHGGELALENRVEGGLRVIIKLPIWKG